MDALADWPFPDDPPNLAVITTQSVLDGAWIARASLDEDGDWQFLASGDAQEEDARVVALRRIVELDASVAALADLPPGERAWRGGPDAPWQRSDR